MPCSRHVVEVHSTTRSLEMVPAPAMRHMPQAVPLPMDMPAIAMKRATYARNATHLSTNIVNHR